MSWVEILILYVYLDDQNKSFSLSAFLWTPSSTYSSSHLITITRDDEDYLNVYFMDLHPTPQGEIQDALRVEIVFIHSFQKHNKGFKNDQISHCFALLLL